MNLNLGWKVSHSGKMSHTPHRNHPLVNICVLFLDVALEWQVLILTDIPAGNYMFKVTICTLEQGVKCVQS